MDRVRAPGPGLSPKPRRHTEEKEHILQELDQPHPLSSHPVGEEHNAKLQKQPGGPVAKGSLAVQRL